MNNPTATAPTVEHWRPILGFEDTYEVSDQGRVRRAVYAARRHGTRPGHVMVSWIVSGYLVVRLKDRERSRREFVHRLVLEAFVGPCPEGMETRHLDGDRSNARLSNLAWGTPSENAHDKQRHGTDHHANATHCKRRHEFTVENTIQKGPGGRHRECRECQRIHGANYRARKRAARLLEPIEGD